MAQQITLYEYLATNVPSDSFAIINTDGNLRKPKDNLELSQQIKTYVTQNGESGLLNLAKIHPDKELIEAICSNCSNNYLTANKEMEKKEKFQIKNIHRMIIILVKLTLLIRLIG